MKRLSPEQAALIRRAKRSGKWYYYSKGYSYIWLSEEEWLQLSHQNQTVYHFEGNLAKEMNNHRDNPENGDPFKEFPYQYFAKKVAPWIKSYLKKKVG